MNKYIVIYHATTSAAEQMANATPEDFQKGMEPWMAWAARCGDGLVDMGAPLGGGQKLTRSGSVGSNRQVVGYSVLQAESMDAAKALLSGHPHLEWDAACEIEVHEALPMPM